MALGVARVQPRFEDPRLVLGDRLRGVYRFLAEYGGRLFPDDYFADLYRESSRGRPTVPARVVATVMILQAQEGLSDQEAVDRLECDLRWQAAAGVHSGYEAFHATVLVGMRNRLRARRGPAGCLRTPRRWPPGGRAAGSGSGAGFDGPVRRGGHPGHRDPAAGRHPQVSEAAGGHQLGGEGAAGVVPPRRLSAPGKPPCDWEDPAAREELVDALVGDVQAAVAVLDGHTLDTAAGEMARLWRSWPARTWPRATTGCSVSPGGGPGSHHFDRGRGGPPRSQVARPSLRRLQDAPVDRSGLGADRRGDRHRGERRGP